MPTNSKLLQQFKDAIPKLNKELHKGQNGRIGIVGGSLDYSGAPYFASMSSLRVGADLSYVLTSREAAPVIKSYSPEMIVLPILDSTNSEQDMISWISRMHSLVIGPGLGRSETAFKSVKIALNCARKQNIPVLIDADGLYILSCETSLVKGLKKCILTPNMMEFKRIYESEFKNEEEYDETKSHSTIELQCQAVKKLAQKLEYITIVKKGYVDIISDGHELILNEAEGMPKRCGGIGDLLSGTIGTFSYWCDKMISENRELKNSIQNSNMIACYASGVFIKECSKRAFSKFRRSVLAVDIIEQIADVFFEMFDK